MQVKQALFLVGGKGSRLGALTASTPKPLLEVMPGLPFLDVLLEQFARHGFTDILLLAAYHAEQFEDRYKNRRIGQSTISVIREPQPAGTGGALTLAADRLDPWFLVSNGDSFFDINLRAFAAIPSTDVIGRLALRRVPDAARFGSVEMQDGRIAAFHEKGIKPRAEGLISAGIYLLSRDILTDIHGPCSIEREVFPRLANSGKLEGRTFEGYFLDMGLPETYQQAIAEVPKLRFKSAVFLDRDGVLNVDRGYTHRVEDLVWIPGAREAILCLNEAGYLVFVVTNQAGIGHNLYGPERVTAFHDYIQEQLASVGAHIDAFYYCPYHPEAKVAAYRHADHPNRKPNPGMILRAFEEWPITWEGSFLIGDKESDIEAARRAGIPGFLFEGGDLRAATKRILGQLAR